VPNNNKNHVKDVVGDHGDTLPKPQTAVRQKYQTKARRHSEKPDVPDKALPGHLKWRDQCHTARNDG
jgi:hypothetical protein